MADWGGKGDPSSSTPINSTPFVGDSAWRTSFLKQVLFWSAQTKVVRGAVAQYMFKIVKVMVESLWQSWPMVKTGTFYSCQHTHTHTHTPKGEISNILKTTSAIWASTWKPGLLKKAKRDAMVHLLLKLWETRVFNMTRKCQWTEWEAKQLSWPGRISGKQKV